MFVEAIFEPSFVFPLGFITDVKCETNKNSTIKKKINAVGYDIT